MAIPDPNQVISITIKKFPQNLLIPSLKNSVSLEVVNNSKKEEHFKFVFEGENLDIEVKPEEFNKEVLFKPGENKKIDLALRPTADGYGKLTINAYWMKMVEYMVEIQKIRETISASRINKILKNIQVLEFDDGDGFNSKDFFIPSSKSEVKIIEKEIKELIKIYSETQKNLQTSDTPLLNGSTGVKLAEIDNKLRVLAKSYLSMGDFFKALEYSLKLSDEGEKIKFYYHLIRANATVNLDATLEVIKNLNEKNKKNQVVEKIALDLLNTNQDQVIKVLSFIDDASLKENALINIISKSLENGFNLALKFSESIEDEIVKIKVLFNIIKKLHDKKNNALILKIINQINQIILNSNKIVLSAKDYKNPAYAFFRGTICIIAELDCPEAADTVIGGISSVELRERVAKDLFNEIYEMVKEKKTKVEPIGTFSQFFLLNTYASKISNEIQNFSLIGGNASSNILMGDYNFNIALISLFSFDFSIFPIIDRVYSDLKYSSDKSFAYYIYPSINNHDQEELGAIQSTLKRFFQPEKISKQVVVFNFDFIPFLGKPTIILSSELDETNSIKTKIVKHLGDRVNLIIDDSLFRGGETVNNLNRIFYGSNFKIVNLVLSYEFINDYDTFKAFIQSIM